MILDTSKIKRGIPVTIKKFIKALFPPRCNWNPPNFSSFTIGFILIAGNTCKVNIFVFITMF